jgi:hypothetical protein
VASPPQRRDEGPRRVSPEELQAIVRRAAELSLVEDGAPEGISEAEVLRIGEELGLSRAAVERAIAETGVSAPAEEEGFLTRRVGPGSVSASRFLNLPAPQVRTSLDHYLLNGEYLCVQRRLGDRTVYEKKTGWVREVRAAIRPPEGRFPLSRAESVETVVVAAGAGCVVGLTADLTKQRKEAVGGGVGIGGVATAVGGVALGTLFLPPLALVALPLAPLIYSASVKEYRKMARTAQLKLEWVLDRLEHGEPRTPVPGPLRRLLGGS